MANWAVNNKERNEVRAEWFLKTSRLWWPDSVFIDTCIAVEIEFGPLIKALLCGWGNKWSQTDAPKEIRFLWVMLGTVAVLHAPLESAQIPARNTQEKYVATQ